MVIKEFFSEIVVVLVRKGSYTTLNIVKDMENLVEERENPKNLVNDQKKVIRNFGRENENFSPKRTSFRNIGLRKIFPSPPKLGARSPPLSDEMDSTRPI